MKTFLNILLLGALVAVSIYLWPLTSGLLSVPATIVGGIGLTVLVAVFGLSVVAGILFALAIAVIAATAPIWLPIFFVVGLVWLITRLLTGSVR